jgi:hypothetical protein
MRLTVWRLLSIGALLFCTIAPAGAETVIQITVDGLPIGLQVVERGQIIISC